MAATVPYTAFSLVTISWVSRYRYCRMEKTIPESIAAFKAQLYLTFVAGINLYIAESVIIATAQKIVQLKNDIMLSVIPVLLGIRSRTWEYTIEPVKKIRMTKGANIIMIMSTQKLFINFL